MDYGKILKRAWEITWRHKALWLFGFLLALFSGGGGSGGGQGLQYTVQGGDRFRLEFVLAIVAVVLLLVLVFVVVGIVLRYLSEGALIGMVREAEETGQTSIRSGWRIGWSHFLRLLGIDLTIGIAAAIVAVLLILMGLSPLLLLLAEEEGLTILAIVLTVLFMLAVIGLLLAMGLVLSVIGTLAYRQSVLEGKGVLDSIRAGYRLGRQNLKQVGVIWLLLFGIDLAFGLVMFALGIAIVAVSAGPAVAAYAASEAVLASILIGLLFAIPGILFLSLLGGVYQVFRSAVWTLTHLELQR